MGDIRKIRKKYQKPNHPWNKERIDAEKILRRDYGLTTKKELWKAETILKGFKNQIKSFPSMSEERAQQQKQLLRARLKKLGLVSEETALGDVLGYSATNILERRLQTIVFKKGLARTAKQARQFIIHEHITVAGKKINAPSYLVHKDEENSIQFVSGSALFSESHPERVIEQKDVSQKQKPTKTIPVDEQPEIIELSEEVDNE